MICEYMLLVYLIQPNRTIDDYNCQWFESRNFYGDTTQLCLRDSRDYISNFIRLFGRWYDCDEIEKQLKTRNGKSYLDIGANIGSCVAAVASQDVKIVAFEASPANFFYLKSTVDKLNYSDIEIYNFGIGNEHDFGTIIENDANQGGSYIRKVNNNDAIQIELVTIDSTMDINEVFDVVQIDVEGSECKVICGALNTIIAGNWKYLQTEFDNRLLRYQNCSSEIYLNMLMKLGFKKIGQTCAFPTFGKYFLIQDYMFEWESPFDNTGQIEIRTFCESMNKNGYSPFLF